MSATVSVQWYDLLLLSHDDYAASDILICNSIACLWSNEFLLDSCKTLRGYDLLHHVPFIVKRSVRSHLGHPTRDIHVMKPKSPVHLAINFRTSRKCLININSQKLTVHVHVWNTQVSFVYSVAIFCGSNDDSVSRKFLTPHLWHTLNLLLRCYFSHILLIKIKKSEPRLFYWCITKHHTRSIHSFCIWHAAYSARVKLQHDYSPTL